MKILKSITTVGFFTMGSRIFGYFRDMLMAALLGAGPITDAMVVAIKLPSLFRRLLAEGAFNAAFVPMFSGIYATSGHDESKTMAEEVLSFLIMVLIGLVIIAEIFIPWLMPVFVPGFKATPDRLALAISFARITFPFILFISITALYSGILNSLDKFAAVAASPMMGNIFIIGLVVFLSPVINDSGSLFAFAIFGCGIIQLLWVMLPCNKIGFKLSLRLPRLTPSVKKLLMLIAPVALGSGVHQINVLIGTAIASVLSVGSISYLYYAERLNQLPLSVIGTAMGTVLLPMLSKQLQTGNKLDAQKTQNDGIQLAMILTMPAMVGLISLSLPIIKGLYQHGAFSVKESEMTAHALMMYATGLPAYILMKIFNTCFYAQKDTKTPLKAALLSVVVDIVLSIVFIKFCNMGHIGIALATSLAAWVNAIFLGSLLWKQDFFIIDDQLRRFMPKLVISSVVTMVYLETIQRYSPNCFGTEKWGNLLHMSFLVISGLVVYVITAKKTGTIDMNQIRLQFKKNTA